MTDRQITIVRAKHGELPYFMMNRATAQDITLSWEARGMLAYLLSKPDDWKVNIVDLQQNCGQEKARSIVAELIARGYMTKTEQTKKERGRFGNVEYQVHEVTVTEKPSTVPPSTVKPALHNTEEQSPDKQKDSNTSPQPAVTVDEVPNPPKADPVPHPSSIPSYTAPKGTRWIYPLNGIHCHLVRDANQPTVTLCGIAPLPSYGGIPVPAHPQVQCAACLKAAEKKPKPERKPQPTDPLFDAIALHLFSAKDKAAQNAVAGRVAQIMYGDKRSGRCAGLINYEKERKSIDALDYGALAKDVEVFWKWFKQTNPTLDLKDCAKFIEWWVKWRSTVQFKPDVKYVAVEPVIHRSLTEAK